MGPCHLPSSLRERRPVFPIITQSQTEVLIHMMLIRALGFCIAF